MAEVRYPAIIVLNGIQAVDGIATDCVLDHDRAEVIIADGGSPDRLVETAFAAGREWERDHPIADLGDLAIDGPIGQPPEGG